MLDVRCVHRERQGYDFAGPITNTPLDFRVTGNDAAPMHAQVQRVLGFSRTPEVPFYRRFLANSLPSRALLGGLMISLGAITMVAAEAPPTESAPTAPSTPAAPKKRLLVFSKTGGFRHDSIPDGIACVRELLSDRFEIDASEDAAVFNSANLERYEAIVFVSTTGDILNEQQQRAFEEFIRAGGGFAGIHAAADTEHTWPWFGKLVGAYFKTHPHIQESTIDVEDRNHPSTRMLPTRWTRTDEWYVYDRNPRQDVRVLMSLDDTTVAGANMNGDHPIAWFQEFEGGRSWYTGGGHTKESFKEPLFRQHLEGGILWAAGASETPKPESRPTSNDDDHGGQRKNS